jgi:ribosomal protein S18 acetylase RimI-like enzyme
MEINIRVASAFDTGSIFELNKKCLPIYYTLLEHVLYTMSTTNLVLVAENKNKEIVGYLIGEYKKNNFHIGSIGTSKKHRSKGIGKMFIDYLINNHNEYNKYTDITLNVHDLNDKGIRFYKKNKFNIIERLNNYYGGQLKSVSQSAYFMKRII